MPQVDIILPTHNRKWSLSKAVRSVQKSSFSDWLLWIIDDNSSDGTKKWIKELSQKEDRIRAVFLNKTEKTGFGVSYARNSGIKKGKSPWIAFLDSDDEWMEQKLEKQMELAQFHPEYPLIHCNELWLKNGQPLAQKKKHKKSGGRIFIPSIFLCCISPSATLIQRELLEKIGLFREDFPVCEDYELWLRVTSRYLVGFVKEALVVKNGGHKDQLSRRYKAMDYWRVKALKNYIKDSFISSQERQVVRETIIKKTNILLKGYEKHKNFTHKKEIENILKLALS